MRGGFLPETVVAGAAGAAGAAVRTADGAAVAEAPATLVDDEGAGCSTAGMA